MGPRRVREKRAAVRLGQGTALLFPGLELGQELRSLGSPGAAGRARTAGVGCSPGSRERVGRREPEARARRRQLSQLRGEGRTHSSRSPPRAHLRGSPQRAEPGEIQGRGSRFLSPLGGSSRSQEASAAPPGAARGAPSDGRGPRGSNSPRACVCVRVCPRARLCASLLPGYGNKQPGLLPGLCSPFPPLPSDSAAQKANGEGASFKVLINLVLVGYSWQLQMLFGKGRPHCPFVNLPSAPRALPALAQNSRKAEV